MIPNIYFSFVGSVRFLYSTTLPMFCLCVSMCVCVLLWMSVSVCTLYFTFPGKKNFNYELYPPPPIDVMIGIPKLVSLTTTNTTTSSPDYDSILFSSSIIFLPPPTHCKRWCSVLFFSSSSFGWMFVCKMANNVFAFNLLAPLPLTIRETV